MKPNLKRYYVTPLPANSGNAPLSLAIAFIVGLYCNLQALDLPEMQEFAVSGLNEFRFADGYDISPDLLPLPPRPWKYLTNSTDVRAGLHGLYLKTRFDVEEPSLGYNPGEPVYREYLSRRTIGFEMDPFFMEAGHISTQFGRGLTLSLKEDRDIEQYTLLDGLYGQLRYSWLTIQAVAGRPIKQVSRPFALLDFSGWDEPDTILVLDGANMRMRNIVAGAYAEAFLPVDKLAFPLLSSGSIGGGLVRYDENVGPLLLGFGDTAVFEKPFWYQNKESFYLPSVSVNLARGGFGLSIDNAWMTGRIHSYVIDSVLGAYNSASKTPVEASTYISANALFSGVSLLAEYKNYFYDRTDAFSDNEFSAFLVPPSARFLHSWHLLNKHMLSNLMGDDLGYNFLLNASPFASTMLTVNFSYGGFHDGEKSLQINPNSNYWEAYAEWAQESWERLNFKVGFDYGKLDPNPPNQNVTFRTLACDIEAGPFGKGHAFSFMLESQLNDKLFFAEKDSAAAKGLISREISPDVLQTEEDTIQCASLVPDDKWPHHRQYAFNLLATLSYHFSPWFSLSLTLEREVLPERDNVHIVTEIESMVNNYASIGLNLKPSPKHTITIEYGSMSGGKKCTLGTCTDLPAFKGFKLAVTSML